MAHSTSNLQSWKPEIDMYIDEELGLLAETEINKLFSVKGTDRLQINDQGRSGFTPMQEVGELGDAVEDQAIETYGFSYSRHVYRKQAVFSSDVLETDQTGGEVENIAKGLVRTVKTTRCLNTYGIFRKAFNTTVLYGDSKSVISTAHPRKDGNGTQTNTFTDGVQRDISYDAVKLLEDQLYSQVSNVGNILSVGEANRNKLLVVPYALREIAFQIAGTNGPDGKPLSADNDKNYFRVGTKFDVYVCPFLGYESAKLAGEVGTVTKSSASNYWDSMYFVIDQAVVTKFFKFFYANGYEKFDDETRKANQSLIKYAYDKYAFGLSSWLGVTGSKGDNSTYAG